jgi:predicted amidophosphoribosyltransferase
MFQIEKTCAGCGKKFMGHPNRVYCLKCEKNWTRERNFHQRNYPRGQLMKYGLEE